jgi:hypothetical protein
MMGNMTDAEVSMGLDLIHAIVAHSRLGVSEPVGVGVAKHADDLAKALGWTAEEVTAIWAKITEANKRGLQ